MAKPLTTLKKTAEFKEVYGRGRSYAAKQAIVYIMKNETNAHRLGVIAGKRIGNSVRRNKFRRRVRELIKVYFAGTDNAISSENAYFDIIVIARRGAAEAEFTELDKGLRKAILKLL